MSATTPFASAIAFSASVRLALDIDLVDAAVEREGELLRRLADAGKRDAFRRRHPACERAAQLALAHHVGPRALGRQGPDDREFPFALIA